MKINVFQCDIGETLGDDSVSLAIKFEVCRQLRTELDKNIAKTKDAVQMEAGNALRRFHGGEKLGIASASLERILVLQENLKAMLDWVGEKERELLECTKNTKVMH